MKIHLVSANPAVGKQREKLQELWKKSSQRHELTLQSTDADIILVTDLAGPDWFRDLRLNASVGRSPGKSFAISDSDFPMPLLHGIYTSASRNLRFSARVRSAAYNLYPDEHLNPLLKGHDGNAYDLAKKHLYSFTGRDSSRIRIQLFELQKRDDACVINTTNRFAAFGPSPEEKESWQKQYIQILNESKYAVCPRGVGAASLRLFECMKMGVAPVILSDAWMLPEGPDWKSFAVLVPEKDILRLPDILKAHELEYVSRGMMARKAYERYFADGAYFDYLIDMCVSIRQSQIIPEEIIWAFRNAIVAMWKIKRHFSVS